MSTKINGTMCIGHSRVMGNQGLVRAINPETKAEMEPSFGLADAQDIARACVLAAQAFDAYRATLSEQRALFLEAIADGILGLGSNLIDRAMLESGLPRARLEGERGRTMNQLRLFAKVIRDGHYLAATLDSPLPDRVPPRPDWRE